MRCRDSACSRIGSRLGASVVFAEMNVLPVRRGWAETRVADAATVAVAVSEMNRRRLMRALRDWAMTSSMGGGRGDGTAPAPDLQTRRPGIGVTFREGFG